MEMYGCILKDHIKSYGSCQIHTYGLDTHIRISLVLTKVNVSKVRYSIVKVIVLFSNSAPFKDIFPELYVSLLDTQA